ncbi:MAG: integration host factor subunit beta [Paludibacteraceae bacterium]|nr:integration host factor subunit beta [Paludibacteraceae bacterium]
MTKIELVKMVAEKTGIDQPTAMAAVEGVIDTLKESLINKESVFIRGWGTWTLKHRAKKTARNISKNTSIVIPEHNIPSFKPAKTFNDMIK